MTIQEILNEINNLHDKISREEPGSPALGDMIVALVALYEEYIKATMAKWDSIKLRRVA